MFKLWNLTIFKISIVFQRLSGKLTTFIFAKKLTRISLAIVLVPGPSGNTKLVYCLQCSEHLRVTYINTSVLQSTHLKDKSARRIQIPGSKELEETFPPVNLPFPYGVYYTRKFPAPELEKISPKTPRLTQLMPPLWSSHTENSNVSSDNWSTSLSWIWLNSLIINLKNI